MLVESKTQTLSDPAFRAAVADVVRTVSKQPDVQKVRSPFAPGNSGQISENRRSALVQFEIKGDEESADERIQPVLDAVAGVQDRHDAFTVAEFGFASANHELNDTLSKDFQRAEYSSLPVTLVILLVAFGALVAAGLPVLLAFSGVLATLGLSSLASHLVPAGDATQSVILLIGMAVGVDYSLFYLRREREERRRGASPRDALANTARTSGHAVFISGLTVLIAMAGMLFTGNAVFTSIAVGAMLMVAVALIGSLSILPALLGKLEHRVDKGTDPDPRPAQWRRVARLGLRARPRPAPAGAGGDALGRRAAPARAARADDAHAAAELHRPAEVAGDREDVRPDPGGVPGRADAGEGRDRGRRRARPEVQAAIGELKQRALASGQMFEPVSTQVNPKGTVETVSLSLAGDGSDEASVDALQTLRHDLLPATVGRVGGVEAEVTGVTAGTHDFNEQMRSHAPMVFAFVLALCFLLLLVTFRSLVIATKAVLLNLLSVGAAYGLLVLVFQHRWAEGLLGFHSNGAITSWLPLFMFVILFGLSMDYHVFILSRIKELRDAGMSTEDAIANGIKRTAWNGHERRDRDGRRVRDLRQPPHARHQADGLRPRGGDPDRRHDRPRRCCCRR